MGGLITGGTCVSKRRGGGPGGGLIIGGSLATTSAGGGPVGGLTSSTTVVRRPPESALGETAVMPRDPDRFDTGAPSCIKTLDAALLSTTCLGVKSAPEEAIY